MNNFPSQSNAANARREMRFAAKGAAKRNMVKLTADQKLNKAAAELVKNNAVVKTDTGFTVSKTMFGFVKCRVAGGKCDCFGFLDNGKCEHVIAARLFAAAAECSCVWNYDDHFVEKYCDPCRPEAERFEMESSYYFSCGA